jgi:8-oxo-dGTP pyrophosphatase MutT (NUDIX family)
MQNKRVVDLVRRLTAKPVVDGSKTAAIAIVLLDEAHPSTLLIKRVERSGDPWSGQIAFPGGKFQEGDNSPRDTAVRETMEEVGIDLDMSSEFLGYFRSFRTHTGNMEVVPAVFRLRRSVPVRIDEEVSSYRWVDLETLASNDSRRTIKVGQVSETMEVPAIKIDDYVIWGLTHRIISALLFDQ